MKTRVLFGLLIMLISLPTLGQTCKSSITPSTPDSRFTVNGDGTVTDHFTKLMWKQCSEGQSGADCTGTPLIFNWQEAHQQAQTVNVSGFAGYHDWRLPNIKELRSIIEVACYDPAINTNIFPHTYFSAGTFTTPGLEHVWSSSPYLVYTKAWEARFSDGRSVMYEKYESLVVRLVRGGR